MIAIGSCYFPAPGDTGQRQQRARDALLALKGVRPINLQFTDEHYEIAGFDTLRVLERDSRIVTGAPGRRKPLVDEMLDALAAVAIRDGCRYVAYLNADIEVTPAALARIESRGLDAYSFCRMDVDPGTRANASVQPFGIDMVAMDVRWWRRERARFRPYIAGEPIWDNVYAAVCCSHGRAEIVDDPPLILHERHENLWESGPFTEYNGYLATLDAPYFTRWATYVARLHDRRASGADVDSGALIDEVFSGPLLSFAGRVRHAARSVVARIRFARARARRARS